MIAHDAARNGKPKADTAGFAVTRILHAEERNEDLFGQIGRNSRPVILDDDVDAVLAIRHADPCALSVAHGIFDQIADGAPQCFRPAAIGDLEAVGEDDVMAQIGKVIGQALHQRREVDRARFLRGRFLACETERGFGHLLHLIDRAQHLLAYLALADKFGAQSERGNRRAQVMTDGGQHAGAIRHETLQALLHPVEGLSCMADILRPGFRKRRRCFAPAQGLGGNGHAAHRAGYAAGSEDHDQRHDQGRDGEGQNRLGCPETVRRRLSEGGVQPGAAIELHGESDAIIIIEANEFGRPGKMPLIGGEIRPRGGGSRLRTGIVVMEIALERLGDIDR